MKLLRGVLAVAYPLLIFAGLQWLEPRQVAGLLAAALLLRVVSGRQRFSPELLRRLAVPALAVAAVLGTTLLWNDPKALLFVPALMNGALLVVFARSLRHGPPLIEVFARLQDGELTPEQVRHCRGVTGVWCVFFAANAGICLGLALWAELWIWTLHTAFISYVLMALLFGAEYLLRSWRFHHLGVGIALPRLRRTGPRS